MFRLKSVLHGLQRTINSGGSTNKGHSRTNSTSLMLSPSIPKHISSAMFLARLGEKLSTSCPSSPNRSTGASGSALATRDEEETLSDGLSSDGYDGDSESDCCSSTGENLRNCFF